MTSPEIVQPLTTALQIALANTLSSTFNVRPDFLVGHSIGEIAAAYVAESMTMKEAIICSYFRGKITGQLSTAGSMATVGLSPSQVIPLLETGAEIGCVNSPLNVTVSGDVDAVHATLGSLGSHYQGAFVRQLPVTKAYHSGRPMALFIRVHRQHFR